MAISVLGELDHVALLYDTRLLVKYSGYGREDLVYYEYTCALHDREIKDSIFDSSSMSNHDPKRENEQEYTRVLN